MNYEETYKKGADALDRAGIAESRLDARLLLEHVCKTDRNTLLAHGERLVTEEESKAYFELISERESRVPLQHLTKLQNFMGLDFDVNEQVLIPRQDTECLVEEVLRNLHDGMSFLDMCTGSGCILVSLLKYTNNCFGVGADISQDALDMAVNNANKLLTNVNVVKEDEVDLPLLTEKYFDINSSAVFVKSDLFEKITGKFDIIVSNPPYIETAVIDTLSPEVKDHEPRLALDGSADGLEFYRKIIDGSKEHLTRGGMLFFEIGYNQGESVKALMEENGYTEVSVFKDYAGLDRVVYGYYI